LWGLLPVYWKLVQVVPADQIIAHRIVWSFLLLGGVLGPRVRTQFRTGAAGAHGVTLDVVILYGAAALLLTLNWFMYVWAINHGHLVEASLGYFITPLLNVLLGVTILRERLRAVQWVAVALGAAGVAYLTFTYGSIPWLALALAATFGTYGLVKKRAPYSPLAGLTLETGVLFVPAAIYLVALEVHGTAAFGRASIPVQLLVAATGVVTTVPLLLFAAAVQRVPLAVIGILQYISPTLNFLLGVVVYREAFGHQQLAGFALVWAALIVFGTDGLLARGPRPAALRDRSEF
jgi:chloramphenicol-sensitive protein RarD